MDRQRKKMVFLSGFTLIEMLVVIIIIGILAGIAFPNFSNIKERALGKEAQASLKLIVAAQRIYRMEGNAYYPPGGGSDSNISSINYGLRLYIPSGINRNWDYTVNSGAVTATATRTRGPSAGCTYTMGFTADDPSNVDCP